MNNSQQTIERAREIVDYDPLTGRFTWKASHGRSARGTRAGHRLANGYRQIQVDGERYCEHRLAWAFVYGDMPEHEIDHRNGDPSDNRITNLRLATRLDNRRNTRVRSDSKTGAKGLSRTRNGRWSAAICVEGARRQIGTFDTLAEASAAYQTAAEAAFGEFAPQRSPFSDIIQATSEVCEIPINQIVCRERAPANVTRARHLARAIAWRSCAGARGDLAAIARDFKASAQQIRDSVLTITRLTLTDDNTARAQILILERVGALMASRAPTGAGQAETASSPLQGGRIDLPVAHRCSA